MFRALLSSLFVLLLSADTVFAQQKNANNKDEETDTKTNEHVIRVNGYADTLMDPSFVEIFMMKQYDPRDMEGEPSVVLQADIRSILTAAGVESTKTTLTTTFSTPTTGGKRTDVGQASFSLKITDITRASAAANALSAKGYNIQQFKSELEDDLQDYEPLDKLLLGRAIQNGKEKAAETAAQLGIKNYTLQRFNENGLKNKTKSGQNREATIRKVRLQKAVTLFYKID